MRPGFEPSLGRVRQRGPPGISRPPQRAPTSATRPDSLPACQPVSVPPVASSCGARRDERGVEIPSRKQAGLLHRGRLGFGLRCHLTQTPCLHSRCPGRTTSAALSPSANREAHPGVIPIRAQLPPRFAIESRRGPSSPSQLRSTSIGQIVVGSAQEVHGHRHTDREISAIHASIQGAMWKTEVGDEGKSPKPLLRNVARIG